MKSKDLISLLNRFDENAEINVFLIKTGERRNFELSDIEVLNTNQIDINIQA